MLRWIMRAATRGRDRRRHHATVVLSDTALFGEGVATVFDVPERRDAARPQRPAPPRS